MREKIKREHESNIDLLKFEYKQKLEKQMLKRSQGEVEMPL